MENENKTVDELHIEHKHDHGINCNGQCFKAGYAARDDEVQTKITKLEQASGWKEIDRKGTKSYEIMKHSQAFMEELVTMMKEENKRIEQALAVAEDALSGHAAIDALEKIQRIKEGK